MANGDLCEEYFTFHCNVYAFVTRFENRFIQDNTIDPRVFNKERLTLKSLHKDSINKTFSGNKGVNLSREPFIPLYYCFIHIKFYNQKLSKMLFLKIDYL